MCREDHPIDTRVCPESGFSYKEFNDARIQYKKLLEEEQRARSDYEIKKQQRDIYSRDFERSNSFIDGLGCLLQIGGATVIFGGLTGHLPPRIPALVLSWPGLVFILIYMGVLSAWGDLARRKLRLRNEQLDEELSSILSAPVKALQEMRAKYSPYHLG